MDIIKEINNKYQALEAEMDKRLEKIQADEKKLDKKWEQLREKLDQSQTNKTAISNDEALLRNLNLLKTLEMAKARLRSRTTFSPVELLLSDAIENYKRSLSELQ